MAGFGYFKESLSQWETSFYGGTDKIISEHPHVSVSFRIDTKGGEFGKNNKLDYYNSRKLLKIFLLEVKNKNLINKLIYDFNIHIESTTTGKNIILNVQPVVLSQVFNLLISQSEYSKLFLKYKEYILSSQFTYERFSFEQDIDINNPAFRLQLWNDFGNALDETEKYNMNKFYGAGISTSKDIAELKKRVTFLPQIPYTLPTIYSDKDIVFAKNLSKELDISFDLRKDVINNLRSGKLDINKMSEFLCGNSNIFYRTEESVITKPFKVCILCDESGSMTYGGKINVQHTVVKVIYKALSEYLPAEEIYVFGHTGGSTPDIHIYSDKMDTNFEYNIDHMINSRMYSQNYDSPVIESIYDRLKEENYDGNYLLLVLSDGAPCGYRYEGEPANSHLRQVVEKCRRDGFVTASIGIKYMAIQDLYNYQVVLEDLDEKKVINKITTLITNIVRNEFQ